MKNKMKDEYKILRGYAWDYFEYHAKQRLTTFNFYILICSLLLTGYFTLLKESSKPIYSFLFGLLLVVLSIIFHKLDSRNRQFVKSSEEALKFFEDQMGIPNLKNEIHITNIFRYEENKTKELNKAGWCKKSWSFSRCFNLIFLIFGLIGVFLLFSSFCIDSCCPYSP